MAQRVLLLRLAICLLALRMAVETVPASARTRTELQEFGPHPNHQHVPPSFRSFFKRSIDRADVDVPNARSKLNVEVEVALNCSSGSVVTDEHEMLVVDVPCTSSSSSSSSVFFSSSPASSSSSSSSMFSSSSPSSYSISSSSSSYYQTPSPGLLPRDVPHSHPRSGPNKAGEGQDLSQAMVSYNTRSNESERSPQDGENDQNLFDIKEVFKKRSLLLEKGVKVSHVRGGDGKMSGGGGEGEKGTPTRCSNMEEVPAAWSGIIKDRSLLCVINPHWLAYSPPSHLFHVIIAALYLVIMVFGLLGNGLVVFLFIISRALRTPSNLFVLNLAASDFLLVTTMPLVVYNSLLEGPAMGRVGCDFYGFMGGITGTTSIMTLAAISLDRYLVISYPLDPFKKLSQRQVLAIIFASWLYSFTFSVMPLLGFTDINYSPEGLLTTCSFDYLSESTSNRIYIFSFFVAAWVVPLNIIAFSYLSIVITVSKQERYCRTYQGTFATSFRHQSLKRKKNVELKLTKVASGIIAMWVIAWTPYAVVALLGIFRQRAFITPMVSMVPAFFCKIAACLDPFVYALLHPRFKAEISKRLMQRRRLLPNSVRNGLTQGVSVSTVSDIREERELFDVQAWGSFDSSASSQGPSLQRKTSCSSNPTLDRTRRREHGSSPGSKSLELPISTEIYPRKSSTYSHRGISKNSRFDEKVKTGSKSPRPDDCHVELRTKALITLPSAPLSRPPFSLSCSFSTGLEQVNLFTQPSAHGWSTTHRPYAVMDDIHPESQVENESPEIKTEVCSRNNDAVPTAALSWVTKRRSNSLPNMTLDSGDERPERKNMVLQIFHARRNRSSSSISLDDTKV